MRVRMGPYPQFMDELVTTMRTNEKKVRLQRCQWVDGQDWWLAAEATALVTRSLDVNLCLRQGHLCTHCTIEALSTTRFAIYTRPGTAPRQSQARNHFADPPSTSLGAGLDGVTSEDFFRLTHPTQSGNRGCWRGFPCMSLE
jgi:hypothetical protein